MANLFLIQDCKAEYSKNLLPVDSAYNGTNTWVVSAGATAINSTDENYAGTKSLKITINDNLSTIQVYTVTDSFTASKSGKYNFAFRLFEKSIINRPSGISGRIKLYRNGVFFKNLEFNTVDENIFIGIIFKRFSWETFCCQIDLVATTVLSWVYEFDATGDENMQNIFYIDGVKIEYDDRKLNGQPTYYTEPV